MFICMVYIVGTIHTIIGKGSQPAYYIKAGCAATHHVTTTAKDSAEEETQ